MSKAADDQVGPSVESEYPEERIAARRLRIAARNETKRRKERGDDYGEKDIKEETRKSQLQVEQSERRVINLLSDGTELITNIQIAANAKESQRRTDLKEARRLRVEKLEKEARSSMDTFEEITRSWSQAKIKVIPQELQEALSSQQQQCVLLLEDKNKLISELQQELKARDDRYVKELRRQAEEVDLMIDRMEEQIKSLMMTYRDELDQIQNAYEHERNLLLTGNRNKWEQHMKDRRDKELENMIQRRRKVEEYETTLQQLRVEGAEEYNTIKDKLESDVQVKQQQLQQKKATNQLRQERLEYECKVLKKREEDNAIIKSQQKRKITRLQGVVNGLKDKCVKQGKQAGEELHGLVDDCTRSMQQYRNMQKKMRHFAAIDAKRFVEMWQMNEAEVRQLAERALDIDQLLHQQQLGLAWERPHIPHMELHSGQIQSANPQKKAPQLPFRQGPAMVDASVGAPSRLESGAEGVAYEEERSEQTSSGRISGSDVAREQVGEVSAKTVKKLLELLCDEAGFLIESKLRKLLSPLDMDNQSLMKLDSIFSAMGIESEDDIYWLAKFFSNYRCQQTQQDETEGGEGSSATSVNSDLLHPNDVLAALMAFTAQYRQPRLRGSTAIGRRADGEDARFWESLANVLPEAKLKTWDALESGLEKYYTVLTKRSQLLSEMQGLKQQNGELRSLLHQSLNAEVNAELEIPPTHMMAPK